MIQDRPKVYVVNQAGHDFSAAERYGDIVFLSRGTQNKFAVGGMYRSFAEILEHSKPDDYLLTTGLTNMNVIAGAMLAYKHGKLNILLYKSSRYIERRIVISELLSCSHVMDQNFDLTKEESE